MLTISRSFHNSSAIETAVSDFYKMMVTHKKHFQKKEPKMIKRLYRHYSNFSAEEYRQYILSLLSSQDLTRSSFDTSMTKCKDAFDIRVPIKRKYLRSNQSPFMNKKISKPIMDRSRLRNRFLRTRSNGDKEV